MVAMLRILDEDEDDLEGIEYALDVIASLAAENAANRAKLRDLGACASEYTRATDN